MTPEERAERQAHYVQGQRDLAHRIVARQAAQISSPEEREVFVKERLAFYERVSDVPAGSF